MDSRALGTASLTDSWCLSSWFPATAERTAIRHSGTAIVPTMLPVAANEAPAAMNTPAINTVSRGLGEVARFRPSQKSVSPSMTLAAFSHFKSLEAGPMSRGKPLRSLQSARALIVGSSPCVANDDQRLRISMPSESVAANRHPNPDNDAISPTSMRASILPPPRDRQCRPFRSARAIREPEPTNPARHRLSWCKSGWIRLVRGRGRTRATRRR